MIERFERRLGVRRMCSVLRVSRSGFYAWRGRPESLRRQQDRRLTVEIRAAFLASRARYGSPRIFHDLRELGYRVSEKRVARLMREEGLQARCRRRFRGTTDSSHDLPVAPNVLGRNFADEEALAAGLADEVVADDAFEETCLARLNEFVEKDAHALSVAPRP